MSTRENIRLIARTPCNNSSIKRVVYNSLISWNSIIMALPSGGCEQLKRRPAWKSTQSDQRLFESTISKLATSEVSLFLLISVAEQVGLGEPGYLSPVEITRSLGCDKGLNMDRGNI